MKHATHPEAGFTLVEAMVSLFIFALVAGGAVLLLSQTLQAQGRVEGAQEELRALQSARSLLVSDIAQIAPRIVRQENQLPAVFRASGGARPTMSFVRATGDPGAADQITTSLIAVSYFLDEEGRLVRETNDAIDPGASAKVRRRVLMSAPGATTFEFNDGTGWRQDWSASAYGIPRAVAITVKLPRYGSVRLQALTGL